MIRFRMARPSRGDGNAMGTYTETYGYDAAGNLLTMAHQVSPGSGPATMPTSSPRTSRRPRPATGSRRPACRAIRAAGPYSAAYAYDAPRQHDSACRTCRPWSGTSKTGCARLTRQVVNAGTPPTTYYAMTTPGNACAKQRTGRRAAGQIGTRQAERIYLGAVEFYREFAADGTTVTLQRETLHVDAGPDPVALVETRTVGNDPAPAQLIRYQYRNQLGSAVLELDDQAQIISYEEYFPYGSTSYSAVRNQTDTPKRYRYTDKERDEENDLYYHGTRYYSSWLGKWVSVDLSGMVDGTNLYEYVRSNPIRFVDDAGRAGAEPAALSGGADASGIVRATRGSPILEPDRPGPPIEVPSWVALVLIAKILLYDTFPDIKKGGQIKSEFQMGSLRGPSISYTSKGKRSAQLVWRFWQFRK